MNRQKLIGSVSTPVDIALPVLGQLAASRAALGHTDQARVTIASVMRLDPLLTLERLAPTFLASYKNALIGTIRARTLSRRRCLNERFEPHVRYASLAETKCAGPLSARSGHFRLVALADGGKSPW